MNDQFILIDPFILKEYNLFSQNTEGSLEQLKRNFAFMKKVNHSIAAKMCANLLNNRLKNWSNCSAQHNSRTKLCIVLLKCENRLENGWEN